MKILKKELKKIIENKLKNLKLHEIVLYSTKFEQIIKENPTIKAKNIDNLIKNYIEKIYTIRKN